MMDSAGRWMGCTHHHLSAVSLEPGDFGFRDRALLFRAKQGCDRCDVSIHGTVYQRLGLWGRDAQTVSEPAHWVALVALAVAVAVGRDAGELQAQGGAGLADRAECLLEVILVCQGYPIAVLVHP